MLTLGAAEAETLRGLVLASDGVPFEPPDGPVDWRDVMRAARRHRLEGLLREGLDRSGAGGDAPVFVHETLEKAWNLAVARAVVRLHHLDELADAAEERGLEACLLKGAAFATTLYAHPALRPMSDLDLLVDAERFEAWTEAVAELGYEARDVSDHAVAFVRRQSGVWLELHRSLVSCARFLGVETRELFGRSRPAPGLGTARLRTLAPKDHLLHLCLHASFQHGFRQPAVNAWDARLLAASEDIDAEALAFRARRTELARWVYGGVAMAAALFPSSRLAALADALEPSVPSRLSRWSRAELTPVRLLSPAREAVFGTPWARIVWAGSPAKTLSLLLEISRPRRRDGASGPRARFQRILQLVSRQGIPGLGRARERRRPLVLRSTTASLGEVRDV